MTASGKTRGARPRWARRDRARRTRPGVAAVLAAVVTGGCYAYVPVSPGDGLAPGQDVRVRVSEDVLRQYGTALPGARPVLEGRVLERPDEGLVLSVAVADRREGFYRERLRQRLLIENGDVQAVERRELERNKTWTLVALGAVAAGAVVAGLLSGDSGGPTFELPPGPSAFRGWLLRAAAASLGGSGRVP